MSHRVTTATAIGWIEQQLTELSDLRNAHVRDSSFKQWRQNTLTSIQRIWVGDASRPRRFRRVPFTPPSTLADPKQARDVYERGCAEAVALLKSWVDELGSRGIVIEDPSDAARGPASPDDATIGPPALTLDVPGAAAPDAGAPQTTETPVQRPATPAAKTPRGRGPAGTGTMAAPAAPRSRGRTANGATRTTPAPGARAATRGTTRTRTAPVMPPASVPPTPAVTPSAHSEADTHATAPAPAPTPPRTETPGRLKDMLGFGHLAMSSGGASSEAGDSAAPPVSQEPVAETPPIIDAPPAAPPEYSAPTMTSAPKDGTGPSAEDSTVESELSAFEELEKSLDALVPNTPPIPPADPEAPEPRNTPTVRYVPHLALVPPPPGAPPARSGGSRSSRSASRTTTRTKSTTARTPARRDISERVATDDDDRALTTRGDDRALAARVLADSDGGWEAAGLAAAADELDQLDVPASRREELEHMLLHLAQSLEAGNVTWDELRAATADVMEHPELGRRVMPLLVACLDHAA